MDGGGIKDGSDFERVRFGEISPVKAGRIDSGKLRHSRANIFVCPTRVFIILEDGTIPDQPCPVDFKTEEGKCSCCGKVLND